jgi:hypothetical protein
MLVEIERYDFGIAVHAELKLRHVVGSNREPIEYGSTHGSINQ